MWRTRNRIYQYRIVLLDVSSKFSTNVAMRVTDIMLSRNRVQVKSESFEFDCWFT